MYLVTFLRPTLSKPLMWITLWPLNSQRKRVIVHENYVFSPSKTSIDLKVWIIQKVFFFIKLMMITHLHSYWKPALKTQICVINSYKQTNPECMMSLLITIYIGRQIKLTDLAEQDMNCLLMATSIRTRRTILMPANILHAIIKIPKASPRVVGVC